MFRFKQFTIQQDRTAMKVCTDACVLGAWAQIEAGTYLLDIGTGTGLLALMAAQRNPNAQIDAVELDEAAAQQAADNVAASPFADRITVHQSAIQQFYPPSAVSPSPLRYDHILTNPPFYVNSLRSPDKAVNRALHTDELPFADLLVAVRRLLAPTGTWWVLLPPPEMAVLRQLAAAGSPTLVPVTELHLRHHDQKPVFRQLVGFRFTDSSGNVPGPVNPAILAIYEPDGRTYTAQFRALLQPYYLIF
ncbi:methyltransferase small [Fibrella aestuarina BUZ 2]|uniref:tRNA1(Val) (adenine(37)-N6)-methyltransferase n=1 Tax=Fibrella aestuarina BUZ 2 TaxID=1166018 RepID=I0K978_9BACT|nr:methyltransferase [Fibrella aestuarina]CCH00681.1 methyltransferase small [Fibrella aestuarina BUZ 2]